MSLFDGKMEPTQPGLFSQAEPHAPATAFGADYAGRVLDELFVSAQQYMRCGDYQTLLHLMCRFHYYSPFNAMLLHTRNPRSRLTPATVQVRCVTIPCPLAASEPSRLEGIVPCQVR